LQRLYNLVVCLLREELLSTFEEKYRKFSLTIDRGQRQKTWARMLGKKEMTWAGLTAAFAVGATFFHTKYR